MYVVCAKLGQIIGDIMGFNILPACLKYEISKIKFINAMPSKIESTLFVSTNLSFSENLRCLNLPLLVGAVSQKRLLS